eukprot:1340974-Amorphochlora_amoeboformis.AAC.1
MRRVQGCSWDKLKLPQKVLLGLLLHLILFFLLLRVRIRVYLFKDFDLYYGDISLPLSSNPGTCLGSKPETKSKAQS